MSPINPLFEVSNPSLMSALSDKVTFQGEPEIFTAIFPVPVA